VRALYPGIRLRLLADLTYDLEEWIHSGRIDLAILTNPRLKSWLSLTDIAQESLYLVTPPTDKKAKSSCAISALKNRTMILTTPNDIVRLALEAHARAKRIPLKVEAEAESIEATKLLVNRGLASTVLPFSAMYREFGRKELQISRIKGLEIRLVLAERADRPKSHAISEVAKVIMTEMSNLQKEGIIR
jgi:LysR family nitrogen assimilation transcriptional regulator